MNEQAEQLKAAGFGWEPPIPFDAINTPDFPTGSLPGPLEAFVECLAESTQTPEEMPGILSLGILSTAFQSKYTVTVTSDWTEPLCLYCVAVAPPGERKSAVLAALTRPIYEYEAEQRKLEAAEIEQNRTERSLLEKALQAAEANAAKKKSNFEEGRAEALSLAAQLSAFQDLHEFQLLADDTTPEKLAEIMDEQGGCITVTSSEGGIFDSMAGRYDKSMNFDVYLKGHSGDAFTIQRIGRKKNQVSNPRLSMILTIQPDVLSGLIGNSAFRGRGLCGRFLYAMCRSKVGSRNVSPPVMPEKVRSDYRAFVRRILSSQGRGAIRLSPAADELRKEYQWYIEKKLGNEWEHLRDWGGKLVGAMLRIAALMHAAEAQYPTEAPISQEVLAGAINIAEFLGAHAEAAYQIMGADEKQADAQYILKRLISENRDNVTRSELTRLCRGKFNKSDDMCAGLDILINRGYIQEFVSDTGYNNRKQTTYLINPYVWN